MSNLLHFQPWGPNADGLPELWPKIIRENQIGEPPQGWKKINRDDLNAYLAPMQAQFDAFQAAQPKPDPAPVEPEPPTVESRIATLESELTATKAELAVAKAKQAVIENDVTTLKNSDRAPTLKPR